MLPIRYMIISRRQSYHQTLLKSDKSKVGGPKKLKISLSFTEIEEQSKYMFKKVVKQACFKAAFKYLIYEKQKLSKGANLEYSSLKTQSYLKSGTGLNTQDIKEIFSIRTRNLFLKTNFPGMFSDDKCVKKPCNERDTEFHLFNSDCFKKENTIVQINLDYNQIFSNDVSKQKLIKDIIIDRYKTRSNILSSM